MRHDGMNYYERKAQREANAAFNAAKKARKIASAKTCQCCARPIFAETGTIAHHGYERPGYGWQTASCMGAKHLPFEVSRDRLGDLIGALNVKITGATSVRAEVAAETMPVRYIMVNYNAPRTRDAYGRRSDAPAVTLDFTRANFNAVVDANTGSGKVFATTFDANRMKGAYAEDGKGGFHAVLTNDLNKRDSNIKALREHLAECVTRFDAWKPTHKFVNKEWVSI